MVGLPGHAGDTVFGIAAHLYIVESPEREASQRDVTGDRATSVLSFAGSAGVLPSPGGVAWSRDFRGRYSHRPLQT